MINTYNIYFLLITKHIIREWGSIFQVKEPTSVGKYNEQFRGELIATVEDLLELTSEERTSLGMTDPTRTQIAKLLQDHQKKLLKSTAHAFNKPSDNSQNDD